MRIRANQRARNRGDASGGGSAPAVVPAAVTPQNRRVITTSSSYGLSCVATADTSVDWYVNGVFVQTLTAGAAHSFTGTWTAPSSAQNITGQFKGNVSGFGPVMNLIIDPANTQPTNLPTYNLSGVTITDQPSYPLPDGSGNFGLVKPSASGSARRLFYKDAVGGGTIVQSAIDIWVMAVAGSVTNCLSINMGQGSGVYNPVTGDSQANNSYACEVERIKNYLSSGMDAVRLQFMHVDGQTTAETNCYMDLMRDVNTETYSLTSGEQTASGMYVGLPRRIDDIAAPFTIVDKFACWEIPADSAALGVTNAHQHYYKHQYVDSIANVVGGSAGPGIKIVYPSGYNASLGTGKVLVALKAQTDSADVSASGKNEFQAMTIDDYANLYGLVIVIVDERSTEGYWAGVMDDGTKNMDAFYPNVLIPWLIKVHGISPLRDNHWLWGWSKSGNVALRQMLRYPTVWGRALSADAAWLSAYASNGSNINYNSSTTYNAQDPYQIINATNILPLNDKKRFVMTGGYAWNTDLAAMKTKLDGLGLQYTYYTSTWLFHGLGPTGTNNGWMPVAIAALAALP